MRTPVLITIGIALAAASAHAQPAPATPAQPDGGVTVNMGALPTEQPKRPPMPRRKPSAQEMHALLTPPMPRHKPDPAALAAETPAAPDAAVAAAPTAAAPAEPATATATPPAQSAAAPPLPRPKPQLALAEAKPPKKPLIGTEALPAPPAPMISPQGATDIAAALRGNAAPGPDPTVGFAVLTRVNFQSGHAELGAEAKVTLDALAARLLANQERVRLAGFSGAPGDTSSDARRLSLARALAVRTYLAGKGIAITRLDVLAFGGSTNGERVDVLVRAT